MDIDQRAFLEGYTQKTALGKAEAAFAKGNNKNSSYGELTSTGTAIPSKTGGPAKQPAKPPEPKLKKTSIKAISDRAVGNENSQWSLRKKLLASR